MTTSPVRPDQPAAGRRGPSPAGGLEARRTVLGAIQVATDAIDTGGPLAAWRRADIERRLRHALAAAEIGDDGTRGRAAAGLRTACAHLAAGQIEDAYLALRCAREQFGSA